MTTLLCNSVSSDPQKRHAEEATARHLMREVALCAYLHGTLQTWPWGDVAVNLSTSVLTSVLLRTTFASGLGVPCSAS